MKKKKSPVWRYIGIAVLFLFLAILFWRKAGRPPLNKNLLAALIEARNELEFPGLTVGPAAKNLKTPEAALTFVQDEVALLPYTHSYCGPNGTLRTRTGNSTDKAVLLSYLIGDMGYETRLVRASWPADAKPHQSTGPSRPVPAVDQVLQIAKGMVSPLPDNQKISAPDPKQAMVALKEEVASSVVTIEDILTKQSAEFKKALPNRKASEVARKDVDRDWVWVEARKSEKDTWQVFDPVFPDLPRPKTAKADFKPIEARVRVVLESILANGKAKEIVSWNGPARDVVGYDITVNFVPADGNPTSLLTRKSPDQVGLWGALMRIGPSVTKSGAFTTSGVVLNRRGDEVHAGTGTAVSLNETGKPICKAVPVSAMEILDIDASRFPDVRVSVALTPESPPSWHHAHFGITEPDVSGNEKRPVKIISAYAAPRPIYLVVDKSGSMAEQNRIELARQGIRALIDQLRPEQRVGLAEFGYEFKVLHNALPLAEAKKTIVDKLRWLYPNGSTCVPEAVVNAIKAAKEPAYIIFLSDGMDSYRTKPNYADRLKRMEEAVKGARHRIITVGIGEADHELMTRIADMTNSRYYRVDKVQDLPHVYKSLGGEISGRVVLSYRADANERNAAPASKRQFELTLNGYKGKLTGSYTIPKQAPPPVTGVRLRILCEEGPKWSWSQERLLHSFDASTDSLDLIAEHRVTVAVGGVPTRVVESRYIDELIDLYCMRRTSEEGDAPKKFSRERGMSLVAAKQLNAMMAVLPRLIAGTEGMQTGHFAWRGPTVFLQSSRLVRRGEDLVRRTELDWLRHSYGPAWEATLQERLAWGVGLAAVEGRLLKGKSVNARMLAEKTNLKATMTGNKLRIHPDKREDILWEIDAGGEVKAILAHTATRKSKGMSVEETAAKYREIRQLLQYYAALGSGGLGAVGNPAGGMFTALCTYFDEVVKLYCYSAVMLGFVGESIESGEFNAEESQKRAADLCELKGGPGNVAKRLTGALGYGFVKGTGESMVGAGIGWGLNNVGVPGFGGTGSMVDRLGDGVMGGACSYGDPTPASTPDFSNIVPRAIAP